MGRRLEGEGARLRELGRVESWAAAPSKSTSCNVALCDCPVPDCALERKAREERSGPSAQLSVRPRPSFLLALAHLESSRPCSTALSALWRGGDMQPKRERLVPAPASPTGASPFSLSDVVPRRPLVPRPSRLCLRPRALYCQGPCTDNSPKGERAEEKGQSRAASSASCVRLEKVAFLARLRSSRRRSPRQLRLGSGAFT